MKEAVSISSTPISVYYSINHGKMFKQVLISVISMCHSNKHNVLHVYLLEPCVPEYAPNVTKITEQEKQILKQVLLQANPDNKLIYLDCSDLCKKYLLSGPNENC
ncbi:MAG: hypothetical protein LBC61_05410 [Candidatus Peribacteria bacterium]|jgi:hypothetical protein|nr:hypothetical protein [Candidatus Peribacteria bacterium]